MSATFEQWIKFVFNNPVRKREWYWDQDFDSRWEALELTDALIVQSSLGHGILTLNQAFLRNREEPK